MWYHHTKLTVLFKAATAIIRGHTVLANFEESQQTADSTPLVSMPGGRCPFSINLLRTSPPEKMLQSWMCHQDPRKQESMHCFMVCRCSCSYTLILYASEAQGQKQYHSKSRRSA